MKINFKRSDFKFTHFSKVEYLGKDFKFERPKNLTKWDLAEVLNLVQPSLHWHIIYDTFSKPYLVSRLLIALQNETER